MSRTKTIVAALTALASLLLPASPVSAEPVPTRISGTDRYVTAAQISASTFNPTNTTTAYVVTGTAFPDALASAAVAAQSNAPVLLTSPQTLPPATTSELNRLNLETIVVVGGTASVSDTVISELEKYAGTVTRVDGPNRYATAANLSSATFPSTLTVYVASGQNFADALSAAPAAERENAPLLLVTKDAIPTETNQELQRLNPQNIVLLGGTAAISEPVANHLRTIATVTRLSGNDRSATSALVSQRTFPTGATTAYLATGQSFADALAAGPMAATKAAPILLVGTNCVPLSVKNELARLNPTNVVLLGGDRALAHGVEQYTQCPGPDAVPGNPSVAVTASPAWNDDGPDPHIIRFGNTWYAYTTGTTWGNHIGVLTSTRPDSGWRTVTGETWGSTAFASSVPAWQVRDTQWAPGVYRYAGKYIMFYAAQTKNTQEWCLSVASSDRPDGGFVDNTQAPIVCQDHLGGVIDPHPFLDANGTPWLHFKNNDGFAGPVYGADAVSKVFAVRLASDGMTPVGSYHEVMAKNTQAYPWQTTVDNPQMVLRGGKYYLFHTGGDYVGNDTYATGYAVCAGPVGPCTTHSEPITRSYAGVAGPGGGTAAMDVNGNWWLSYHAYPEGCYDYSCGERRMYVAPMKF